MLACSVPALPLACVVRSLPPRYERLDAQLAECYPQDATVQLKPSPGQLADLVASVAEGAGG